MKKYLKFAVLPLVGLMLASCGNDDPAAGSSSQNQESSVSVSSSHSTGLSTEASSAAQSSHAVSSAEQSSAAESSHAVSSATESSAAESSVVASSATESSAAQSSVAQSSATQSSTIVNDDPATIFLAGDSTVKTYLDAQYIGGWGQYLDLFLDDNITVKNCAQGGRSARSFINEGRLYDIENPNFTYKFSENNGNSIGDEITDNDYLFIQFGHNDDATKMANSLAERMVPLGEPDAQGIYPTTPGTKTQIVRDGSGQATMESISSTVQTLMADYQSNLTSYLNNSVNKYGSEYYEYSSGGTYKWFLKQYIDFARSKGATPVLVTPVARLAFNNDGTLKSGPGLHGDNFAYVQAVRQLAKEENCMLIDLFEDTKEMLETAKPAEAYYLMSLKDASGGNSNQGLWPQGFDTEYASCTHEATHYNKFGAFLTAGKVAESLNELIKDNKAYANNERIEFVNSVLEAPEKYIAPSNLMHKQTVQNLYGLFTTVDPVDKDFQYPDPKIVEDLITKMVTDYPEVTQDNYLEVKDVCEEIRSKFVLVNVDDLDSVSNKDVLVQYEGVVAEFVKVNRKVATETIIFNPSGMTEASGTQIATTVTYDGFKIVGATGKEITVMTGTAFTYNDVDYTTTKSLSMGGSATFGTSRYIEFTTTKTASITVVAKSSSASADRIVKMVDSSNKDVTTFAANGAQSITTVDDIAAGTYRLGSAGSGMYIYAIIIEYFD